MTTELSKMVPPVCNLNGSPKEGLLDAHVEARRAVMAAVDSLVKIAPNGRDYQTLADGVFDAARTAWRERVQLLQKVASDIYDVAIDISNQDGVGLGKRRKTTDGEGSAP